MNVVTLDLTCHVCGRPQALTCKIVRVGEGVWVSLVSQRCPCYAYDAWQSVWAEARWRKGPSKTEKEALC